MSFDSATQLTAQFPGAPAGSYPIVVTNPDGQSFVLANAYTYADPPTVTAVSPTSGPLAGSSIVITGTGFTAGATATIGGTAATTTGWTATIAYGDGAGDRRLAPTRSW